MFNGLDQKYKTSADIISNVEDNSMAATQITLTHPYMNSSLGII